MSVWPCALPTAFQAVWPCRTRTIRRPGIGSAATARGDVGRHRDHRAVAPEAFEGVELAFLRVLDVYDDLGVVDQHPATVALALAAYGLGTDLAELVLDLVDDRLHLPLVARRAEQEGVGDDELV